MPDQGALSGERLLIAPITITPTKPVLPTHAKGFLWLDALYRGTRALREATYLWNTRSACLTGQTLRFWEYLDRTLGHTDFTGYSVHDLGALYVRAHAEPAPPFSALRPYAERAEQGWVHPGSERILRAWKEELGLLHVLDPGFFADRPYRLPLGELIDLLAGRGLCLDHRRLGGPVYLDGTRWGMPLRPVVGMDGHANYLLMVLRDLVPRIAEYDGVLLVHDEEIGHDYALVERILGELGARTSRLALGRVPIPGAGGSSRTGGWDGTALDELSALCLRHVGHDVYRLGMRLHFINTLRRTAGGPLKPELIRRAMARARKLLARADGGDPAGELSRHLTPFGWVDPYRLTCGLLTKTAHAPSRGLLDEVFL
ncbi:hypothetical protein ETD83_14450 [Actinomadura soli]|uniref:Uncharacterized protein n=1 Tax=Actinomadura soli TaxID=2508997 RepID=A0A5C4JCU6_9ACTN|nr:hypothetical protein [Actinomadura soli]TMR01573.1 hypothetical protein ETD83_14450 [Actinomadura soli]